VTVPVPVTKVTVALAALLMPPAPEQVSPYVVVAVIAAVGCAPLAANAPVQPFDAVQVAALDELHVNCERPPLVTEVGFAVSVAVGTTLTVTFVTGLVPPVPVHVNENKEFDVTGPLVPLPLLSSKPDQLFEAVQLAALTELQVSVDAAPLTTGFGDAVNVTVGTGTTVTVAEAGRLVPPAPVQVNV
jgi:hypothetical protein